MRSLGTNLCWWLVSSQIQLNSYSYFFSRDSSWAWIRLHKSTTTFWPSKIGLHGKLICWSQFSRIPPLLFVFPFLKCSKCIRSRLPRAQAYTIHILRPQSRKPIFRMIRRAWLRCKECRHLDKETIYWRVCGLRWRHHSPWNICWLRGGHDS